MESLCQFGINELLEILELKKVITKQIVADYGNSRAETIYTTNRDVSGILFDQKKKKEFIKPSAVIVYLDIRWHNGVIPFRKRSKSIILAFL